MKKIFSIIVISLLFVSSKKDQNDEAITYSIDFDKDNLKIAKVKVEFTPKDSTLYMDYGSNDLKKGWATFIHNLKAANKEGKTIKLQEIPEGKWKIHSPSNIRVVLTYEVHLDHEDYEWDGGIDGVAYTTDMGIFYTGKTVFILNGEQRDNITVNFQLPTNWKVTTPWPYKGDLASSYSVMDYKDLTSAIIFAGTHKELSLKRKDFEFLFALGSNEIIADEAMFYSLAEGVLDYYIQLFGGIPIPSPDNPFNKMVVVISSHPSITDGEVIGNNISILIQEDADQFSETISKFIFAHEFFHLWNGKSFRPNSENAEWFKEGLTNYYTLKALHQTNFLTEESYLEFLRNFFYVRYNNDIGLGTLSMTNGEEKHEHWGLIYGGGMLAGIAQDMIIRNATNNEKSMDDLMRSLYKKYGNSNEEYSLEELQNRMSELSGSDQSNFFTTYVSGTNKIPIDNYLKFAGLDAKIQDEILIISKLENPTQEQQKIMEGLFGKLSEK